jgi:hypothetical protein
MSVTETSRNTLLGFVTTRKPRLPGLVFGVFSFLLSLMLCSCEAPQALTLADETTVKTAPRSEKASGPTFKPTPKPPGRLEEIWRTIFKE